MSSSFNVEQCFRSNEARYLEYGQLQKAKDGSVYIPSDMHELFVDDDWVAQFESIDKIPYTKANVEHLMQIYIQAVYFEHWYIPGNREIDAFTIPSQYYPLEATAGDIDDVQWKTPKFVRLNSVSPKFRAPVYSLSEAREVIASSPRCIEAIQNAIHYGFSNFIVIRDWKDLSAGNEYRCFIYNDRLTAITNHDGKVQQSALTEDMLVKRIQRLLDAAMYYLPHSTVCMDCFVHDSRPNEDCVIEFSAYGPATDTGSGAFHWLTDMWCGA